MDLSCVLSTREWLCTNHCYVSSAPLHISAAECDTCLCCAYCYVWVSFAMRHLLVIPRT